MERSNGSLRLLNVRICDRIIGNPGAGIQTREESDALPYGRVPADMRGQAKISAWKNTNDPAVTGVR
jgi:hypothetical protein